MPEPPRGAAGLILSKRCAKCGRDRSPAAFRRRAAAADGLQSYCRDCQKVWLREVPGRRPRYRRNERARQRTLDALWSEQ